MRRRKQERCKQPVAPAMMEQGGRRCRDANSRDFGGRMQEASRDGFDPQAFGPVSPFAFALSAVLGYGMRWIGLSAIGRCKGVGVARQLFPPELADRQAVDGH